MTAQDVHSPPPRGTRPRNRRALILTAASELFYQRGFDQVSMSDIAERVAIAPSALYRHFPGKQDLLFEAVHTGLQRMGEQIESSEFTTAESTVAALAAPALADRRLGALWQREARYLPAEQRALLRAEFQTIAHRLTALVVTAPPTRSQTAADLTAWAIFSVLVSPSFHHADLPRGEYERLIGSLANTVLGTAIPSGYGAAQNRTPPSALQPISRREALLEQAVRMFAEDGYASVGIEDVGASVGITGPSVYNHFTSKLDLLLTAINRGSAYLMMDLSRCMSTAEDPAEALTRLTESYIRFALEHHHVIDLTVSETRQLPDEHRQAALQIQREYLAEWQHLMQLVRPSLDPVTARVRLQAAITVINDASRTTHLRNSVGLADALAVICGGLLLPDQAAT